MYEGHKFLKYHFYIYYITTITGLQNESPMIILDITPIKGCVN